MSVATHSFDEAREVKLMVSASVSATRDFVRPRPHGVSKLAMRFGAALVKWGRDRSLREVLTHEEQARRIETEAAMAASRSVAALRPTL